MLYIQGLENNADGETNPSSYQIDANFALDDDESDNDNDSVDKDDDDGKAPTIQLRVALGEFDDDENILGTQTMENGTDERDHDESSESATLDLTTKKNPSSSLLLLKKEESDKKTPKQRKILIEELT